VPLLANALQYFSSFANGVQRLEETPLEIRIRGEQSGQVVEFATDRRNLALFPGQREKSARVAVSGFVLHD
jgi:hypothetical protein